MRRKNGGPREDALPENLDWRDTGCEVAPKCLECPLEACRYDVAGGARALRNITRDREIREAHANGEAATEIAARYGLSARNVWRVVAAR